MANGKVYGGIDPGKHGAISVIHSGNRLFKAPFPLIGSSGKEELDYKKLAEYFRSIKTSFPDIFFVLEEVHSIYGTSASSNFTFGFNNGLLVGMLHAMNFRYTMVQPKAWQKEMWVTGDRIMKVVKGKSKLDTKATSSKAAARLFPSEDFTPTARSTKDHDGMVDSALLAKYGQQKNF